VWHFGTVACSLAVTTFEAISFGIASITLFDDFCGAAFTTQRNYWSIKLGEHTQLPYRVRIASNGLSTSVSISLYKYPVLLIEV
jgi:hypothetical protein